MDETSHILKIQTGKQLYKQGQKNVKAITKDELKINLFGALNINGDSFHEFLKDMEEVIPSMNALGYYSKEQSKYTTYDEAIGIEKEWLEKYEILQYNYLFDDKNRSEVFFGE